MVAAAALALATSAVRAAQAPMNTPPPALAPTTPPNRDLSNRNVGFGSPKIRMPMGGAAVAELPQVRLGTGDLKQGRASGEGQQSAVLQKSRVTGSLGAGSIARFSTGGTAEINLIRANPI